MFTGYPEKDIETIFRIIQSFTPSQSIKISFTPANNFQNVYNNLIEVPEAEYFLMLL